MEDILLVKLTSCFMTRWISAGTSVGALIGALGGGTLADRIGRKWVLAIGDLFFVVGAVIICASFSVPQIIVGRVVLGFGVGIAAGVAPLCAYSMCDIESLVFYGSSPRYR